MKIRIGTRGSSLALFQAERVRTRLEENTPLYEFELKKITTKADKIQRGVIAKLGSTGVFTKEIDEALLAAEIDLAVHSAKDIPTQLLAGLEIVAVLERDEVRDALVTPEGRRISDLPARARFGTSSPRRIAQMLRLKPDARVVEMRGNVETRIRKMREGQCDALVMSACGLLRLGLQRYISEVLSEDICLPAVGQGAIAVTIRANDAKMREVCKCLNHELSFQRVEAERSFLRNLQGGCQVPVGAFSSTQGLNLSLKGAVFSLDGREEVRSQLEGPLHEAVQLGKRLAEKLASEGALTMLQLIRS